MNINDELLIMVQSSGVDNEDAISMASMCLYELYKQPFFNGQYEKYNLAKIDGDIYLNAGNFTYSGNKKYLINNSFNYKLVDEIYRERLKANNQKSSEGNKEDYNEEYDEYIPEKEIILKKSDKKELQELKICLKDKSLDKLIKFVNKKLDGDKDYLLRIYSMYNKDKLFKTLRQFIKIDKESNSCQNRGIKLYFDTNKSKKYSFENVSSGFYYRDVLNDWFIFSDNRYNLKGKEILKGLMNRKRDFNSFLNQAGIARDDTKYRREEYSSSDIKKTVKNLIRQGNEYAIAVFKMNPEKRAYKLTEMKFEMIADKIIKDINEMKISDTNIDDLIFENKEKIKEINGKIIDKYPYLKNNYINKDDIELTISSATMTNGGYLNNNVIVLSEHQIKEHLPELNGFSFYKISGKNNYDKKSNFEDFQNNSKFIIGGESSLSRSDGFSLFGKGVNYSNDKVGFYIDFKIGDHVVAKVSLFKENKNIMSVGSVEISKMHQGQGLSYYIYEKLADICINNKLILRSSSYTEIGKSILPKVKEKVSMKKDGFILAMTTCYGALKFDPDLGRDFVLQGIMSENNLDNYDEILKVDKLLKNKWKDWIDSYNKKINSTKKGYEDLLSASNMIENDVRSEVDSVLNGRGFEQDRGKKRKRSI